MPSSTLNRPLRAGRFALGFFKAKLRTGLCDYCQHFDRVEVFKTEGMVYQFLQRLEVQRPDLMKFWQEHVKTGLPFRQPVIQLAGNPCYWNELFAFMRASVVDTLAAIIVASFAYVFLGESGRLQVAGDWQLRGKQDGEHAKVSCKPPPRTRLTASDFADQSGPQA